MAQDFVTRKTIEQIGRTSFHRGAFMAIKDMDRILMRVLSDIKKGKSPDDTREEVASLYRKYTSGNLLSGDELDEAQQKSE